MEAVLLSIAKVFSKAKRGVVILVVGLLFFLWVFNTPGGLLGKADAVGYAVCHRIDVRSFHLGDRAVPLCARCSGMYLGAVLGLIYQGMTARRSSGMPPWQVLSVFGLFFLAFAFDGSNSFLSLIPGAPSLYQPNNTLRLFTGTGMGLAMAGVVFPAFNQTVWKGIDASPALSGMRSLSRLVVLAGIMDYAVLTENPLALYPLALISAAGVLTLLTLVYTMLWLMLLRLENRFENFTQLIIPLIGGFGSALLQIALLDFVRFIFTGTWDGFHLG